MGAFLHTSRDDARVDATDAGIARWIVRFNICRDALGTLDVTNACLLSTNVLLIYC